MREGESGSVSSKETGGITQQNWNTPFSQAKNNDFDSYVLIGQKGGETVVYGSSDFQKSSELFEGLGGIEPTE